MFGGFLTICHFSPPLYSALTLAEGFSFFSFSPPFRVCFLVPGSNALSPGIMPKLKPSAALFRREPGERQDLYPPPAPSSSPPQRRSLANPSDSPEKPPPSPSRVTRFRAGCPHVPKPARGDAQSPGSPAPGCIAPLRIPDSFLAPAVGKGIPVFLFSALFRREEGVFLGAAEPRQTPTPPAYFWSPRQRAAAAGDGVRGQRRLGGRKPPLAHAVRRDTH